ncbi:two-component sensor histidine kinase [Microbacterium barkeri]|uniref:Two-component sensor histidine kinase n=2 Tax=Microbacterium barkeri TaxID=33917 RepID=A0A9W6LY32_9MICO|nr:histidine kinase [Microbacterium barkeri]MDR6876879.1 two-component system sensor histidine kinase DesK [Microbacterium barkeri]GLJ62860.1 two-component sensor histidine kinase [Microbacterium barkeri]
MSTVAPAAAGPRRLQGPWERWGWLMAVVWMVFLIYPVMSLVNSTAPIGWRVLGWATTVGFAVLYVVGFVRGMRGEWHRPAPSIVVIFWCLIACAAATVPAIETQALSFLPFVMAYASYGLGRWWHWAVNAVSIALAIGAILLTGRLSGHAQLLAIMLMLAVVNSVNTWLIRRSIAAEELRVQLATTEERASVARDVHDLVGHSLTVVKLKAELASRLVDRDPERARAELDAIVRLATEAIAGVRSTVTGLQGVGFADQLVSSRAALETAGLDVETVGAADALSPAQSLPAAWILREATTNILRHAGARRARIEVAPGTLVIEDDGSGTSAPPGNGMRGMAERATAAGATLSVEARGAGGTKVSVTW